MHRIDVVHQALIRSPSKFGIQQLSSMLWSLVTIQHTHKQASIDVDSCAEVVFTEVQRKIQDVNPQGITMLLAGAHGECPISWAD